MKPKLNRERRGASLCIIFLSLAPLPLWAALFIETHFLASLETGTVACAIIHIILTSIASHFRDSSIPED